MRRSLYNEQQLWLPLISIVPWLAVDPTNDVVDDPVLEPYFNHLAQDRLSEAGVEHLQPSINDEASIEWSENDTLRAHGGLLELSLSALTHTGNAAEKADILNWVFTDWIWDWKYSPEGSQITKTHAKKIPFSFLMCCEASGMDPEVIREYLMQRLKARQTTMH